MAITFARKFLLAVLVFVYADVQATSQETRICVPGDVVSVAVTEEMCSEIVQEVERLKDAGMSDDQIITAMTFSKEDAQNWGYIYKRNKTTIRRFGIILGISGLALVAAIIGLIIYYAPTEEQRRFEAQGFGKMGYGPAREARYAASGAANR